MLSLSGRRGRRPKCVGKGQTSGSRALTSGEVEREAGVDGADAGDTRVETGTSDSGDFSGALRGSFSGKKKAGFKRSIVTVNGFPLFRITKVLGALLITGKGASYGGVRGLLTASTRRKTWLTASKEGST